MELFYAKHSVGALTSLLIDTEDKVTGKDVDFFDDVPSEILSVCDDAQDVIMEWHDRDEWEDAEQLFLLESRRNELDSRGDMLLLSQGDTPFIGAILENAGITAVPKDN